jgi:hypothetical protein
MLATSATFRGFVVPAGVFTGAGEAVVGGVMGTGDKVVEAATGTVVGVINCAAVGVD